MTKYPKGMHVKFINCSVNDLKRLKEFLEEKRHCLIKRREAGRSCLNPGCLGLGEL